MSDDDQEGAKMAHETKFKIKYGIDDGYAGGSRPQSCTFHAEDIDDSMTEAELEDIFHETITDAMFETVRAYGDSAEFIEWAKKVIEERIASE